MRAEREIFYLNRLKELHDRLLSHSLVQNHLSGERIKVDGIWLDDEWRIDLNIGNLDVLQFAHIFTVFNGSRVHIQAQTRALNGVPPGDYATVINTKVIEHGAKNRTGISKNVSGGDDLFIQSLYIDRYFIHEKAPATLGTLAFGLCAINVFLLDVEEVTLIAAGGRHHGFDKKHIGYYFWPLVGFDAPLIDGECDHVEELKGSKLVSQVMKINPVWWKEYGSQRLMTFDLAPESSSWQTLISYLDSKLPLGGANV